MGRRRKRSRRSLENPTVPLTGAALAELLDDAGGKSAAGTKVTANRVLGYPPAWRAVNLIAGDVGKLPLRVYRQTGANREPAPDHPAYRLLLRKPNPLMTAFTFKQTVMGHVLLRGNGYAYVDRDGAGRPTQLLVLDPCRVTPVKVGGRLWYVYEVPVRGNLRKLPAEDVLHVKGLGYDGLQGYPVLQLAKDSFGAALAARDHSGRYFKNGARPGGVLKHPGKLTDTARRNMRESWERIHSGLENAHKVAILEEGTDYSGFSSNARDAQLLESRAFDAKEIANIFGVPTHKLGDSDKVAYNSLGEENQSYYDDTLSRWLQLFAEEGHDKLLSEEEKAKETHCVAFDYQEIARANLQVQADLAVKGLGAGIFNQDEARALFGYNPLPGGKGQRYFVPTTLVPVDQAGKPTAPTPPPAPDPAPARRAIPAGLKLVAEDVAGRMARRLLTHFERAQKARTDFHAREHEPVMAEAFGPVSAAARDCGLAPPEPTELARRFAARFAYASASDAAGCVADMLAHFVRSLESQ